MFARHMGFTIGLPPLCLFADLSVQFAQGCHDIEVKIASKYKGPNNIVQPANRLLKCRWRLGYWLVDHSGLDPGIAFPLPALDDEILLKHAQADCKRARVAIGPQP